MSRQEVTSRPTNLKFQEVLYVAEYDAWEPRHGNVPKEVVQLSIS